MSSTGSSPPLSGSPDGTMYDHGNVDDRKFEFSLTMEQAAAGNV